MGRDEAMGDEIRDVSDAAKTVDRIRQEVGKVVVGQKTMVDHIINAILCNGNALLEGVPGIGKTLTVRTLAQVMDLEFSRIQGTPDLMPSDITGTYIVQETDGKKDFQFQQGPIFANVVLADEVNRATPKTQSALLEAMQEQQVTVGNQTFKLADPFFVLATQNPIDLEGSLSMDQSVFFNGELVTGDELVARAEEHGVKEEENGKALYYLPGGWTYAANEETGNLEKQPCFIYTLPYDDELVHVKTRTGREVTVTKNHPFLVNESGSLTWKTAEALVENDALATPGQIGSPEEKTEVLTHEEALNQVAENYDVVRGERVAALREQSQCFTDFSQFTGKDFDDLRIALQFSLQDLATAIDLDDADYAALRRFLGRKKSGDTKRGEDIRPRHWIHKELAAFFVDQACPAEQEYVAAHSVTALKPFTVDEDIMFFLAYLLSDGSIQDYSISISQANYPESVERFITVATEKIGVDISQDRTRKNCRHIKISSKPFIKYLTARFGLTTGKPHIPGWMLSLPQHLRRTFLQTFISLEGHIGDRRITFTQKERQPVNMIAYMLLQENLLPWIQDRDRVYRLKLHGNDALTFMETIGWITGENPYSEEKPASYSMHQTVPVPRQDIFRIVELLGLDSFHTFPDRDTFSENSWYSAYKDLKHGKQEMSTAALQQMITDLQAEITKRKRRNPETLVETRPRQAAVHCGIALTDIVAETDASKHSVWQVYNQNETADAAIVKNHIKTRYRQRLQEAETLLNRLETLDRGDLMFDTVSEISRIPYTGRVFGLTVPDKQNYIGGFGSCGIHHNTFPLNEAATDRFLLKIKVEYPDEQEEQEIITRFTQDVTPDFGIEKVVDRSMIKDLQELTREVPVSDEVKEHAVRIVKQTRDNELIEFGASPRASMGLILTGKARALMQGRSYVSMDDIHAMAPAVLRHRIVLDFVAEKENLSPDDVIKKIVDKA